MMRLSQQLLPDDWAWDVDAERGWLAEGEEGYAFTCEAKGDRPAATVFLQRTGPGLLRLVNVIPRSPVDSGRLTEDEHNRILEAFLSRILRPFASKHGASVTVTQTWDTPEDESP